MPSTIGRYEILKRIARGGMGTLYVAWDPKLDRQIAIKILTDDNDDLRQRFAREARSVARLRHPNIVTVFDVGDYEGQPFIAMEYVHGETLAVVIQNRVPLTTERKLEIIEELAEGLAYAHGIGVVHRDIKPANIMLEPGGSVKILDFGIARVSASTTMTVAGMLIGTLNYMSPEQAKGQAADNRSDVYAVGAVLYELLSYRQAFPGGMDDGVLHRVVHQQPDPLEKLCPGIDPEIISIVQQALEKDPGKRYQDLGGLAIDIRRIRQRLPTMAPAADAIPTTLSAAGKGQPSTSAEPWRKVATDREELARRRARQIEEHLDSARRLFSAGDYDSGISACEQVLIMDAENVTALELLERAHVLHDERQAEAWLNEAALEIEREALTAALANIARASELVPSSTRAAELRKTAEEALAARERARQRAETLRNLIYRAHELFDEGRFQDAIAEAEQALALEAGHPEAQALKTRSLEAIRAREIDVLDRRAREAVREARRLFAADNPRAAIDLLAHFDTPHDLIAHTLEQLTAEAARIAEQRALEAERRAKRERIVAELDNARAEMDAEDFGAAVARLRALVQSEGSSPEIVGLTREAEAGQEAQELAAKTAKEVAEHVARAAGFLARHSLDEALERVDAALAASPDHKAAQALRSKIVNSLRTAAEVREAVAARKREREQHIVLALSQARQTISHAVAIDILGQALDLEPDHPEVKQLLQSRQAALAQEVAEQQRLQALEAARQEQIQQLVMRAREAFRLGDFDAARKEVYRTIALDPTHADAHSLLQNIEVAIEQRRVEMAAPDHADKAGAPPRPGPADAPAELSGPADAARVPLKPSPPKEMTARGVTSGSPEEVKLARSAAPLPLDGAPQRVLLSGRRGKPRTLYLVIGAVSTVAIVGIIAVWFATVGPTPSTGVPPNAPSTAPVRPTEAPSAVPSEPARLPSPQPETSKPTAPKEASPVSGNSSVAPVVPTPGLDPKVGTDAQVDSLRQLAREQLARRDAQQALATINRGLKILPGDSALRTLLNATLTDARARLREARDAANLAGDAATRSPRYAEAMHRDPEVVRLARAGRTEDAIRSAWIATDLFTRALEDSKRASTPSIRPAETSSAATRPTATQPSPPEPVEQAAPQTPAGSPPPVSLPRPSTEPVSPPAPAGSAAPRPTPPPQAPVPAAQAPPPVPTAASEDLAIRAVLKAYTDAYSARDANAVKRVFPTVNVQALQQSFSGLRTLQVRIPDPEIMITGTTATVAGTWVSVYLGQVGGEQRASPKIVLRLQKSAGTWVVIERR
jgi:tetratricopeptide (TPR) repeat protein/predicted Ser/Thr protein kinase